MTSPCRCSGASYCLHASRRYLDVLVHSSTRDPNSTNKVIANKDGQSTSEHHQHIVRFLNAIQRLSRLRRVVKRLCSERTIEQADGTRFLLAYVDGAGKRVISAEEGYKQARRVRDGNVGRRSHSDDGLCGGFEYHLCLCLVDGVALSGR